MILQRISPEGAAEQPDPAWKKWGPYLSERQWGTVREDYSSDGNAWDYFSHDQARSRAYRWGEDGLAGISDDRQRLCFALALWNGRDPILKERAFGLTNAEGNHGEDVKEYYFYLDSTPTHSFMKYLYKYPQAAYPYDDLVRANQLRDRGQLEYELIDTGVFDQDRYFDVFVDYAKASPEDILIKITAHNRGPDPATLHLLPTLWFRNTWWMQPDRKRPWLGQILDRPDMTVIKAWHPDLGDRYLYCWRAGQCLFTDNETNCQRLFGTANPTTFVKDGIHEYMVHGVQAAVNPDRQGTKVSAHYQVHCAAGQPVTVCLRLTPESPEQVGDPAGLFGPAFDEVFRGRQQEADELYDSISPQGLNEDQRRVMRQALAGMLWSKQYYCYPVGKWLEQRGVKLSEAVLARHVRNAEWLHMVNEDIISMPDKWEYPWYAAWDLAFHAIALSMVDPDFAKRQLNLMLEHRYMHPNGQLPAYEWNFSDVNPPVHAFATIFIHRMERVRRGRGDTAFLKLIFQSLMLNFSWWINRKDATGRNVFEGGFLGLDNISVFDRSAPLPTGGRLEQADGTAWMGLYSLLMFDMAMELADEDALYQEMAARYIEHFLLIRAAMNDMGGSGQSMWDDQDGFFYDLLRPDGQAVPLKVRSVVGLLPLCAVAVVEAEVLERFPYVAERVREFASLRPDVAVNASLMTQPGAHGRRLLSLLTVEQIRRILSRMLDENEFLSPYGIRSLSRWHAQHPYVREVGGQEFRVEYLPAESDTGLFGGNSNWRGPIWFPINIMIIRALLQMYVYAGDEFKVECPTGSNRWMTLFEVAMEICSRLGRIFLRDEHGRRAVYGGTRTFQEDPHWRDYILFYEYFHGDSGAGLGASHQTGWTGLIAQLLQLSGSLRADALLSQPISAIHARTERAAEPVPRA